MSLTALEVKKAKAGDKLRKLPAGKSLYLHIPPTGAKYWRLAYRFAGKQKTLALGVYPDISLKEAIERRDEARKLLANGTDPGEVKRAKKAANVDAAANSFESIASEWFHIKMCDKSQSHQDRTWRALQKDLFPLLSNRPIKSITPPELLAALRKIEARGAVETAHRAKQTCGQIFRYAIATGRAERDPSADLKGALRNPVEQHLAAITDPAEVGKLLVAIEAFQGTPVVKAALKLSPLLFCRPGELRHMEWEEINWDSAIWEIPASKMKIKQPHIVPLSNQALLILEELRMLTGRGLYVFPSARGTSRPLSENGVRTALRTMGYDNQTMTPHGFRAMARTILDEVLNFPPEWIEHQLAHAVKDSLGRAYNRTSHLPQRIDMMQQWADYLEMLKKTATPAKGAISL
ncbi:integrase arm-type DNA-binding domain-containing protein [Aestuariicella hydrocarbonica]|uniref:Integrase arm-type DNA-binding domain-containing protein n=1 Tax=Pseudomaricurvus hydrocarbonicus TaxID=1470433 RepID=A0A9E5MKR2_9GAMM|nr:integrase arm-type DNA-binding domain-containing protein [Aestuariicella hydrocarbonica]NHO66909.1 integrase arm-type DNA-binding domain-containing protein [Aestuariicella hydrocarbonica]